MNPNILWYLVFYGIFSQVVLAPTEGWLDSLGSFAHMGLTVYFAYNLQWVPYRHGIRLEEYEEKGTDGKVRTGFRVKSKRRDFIEDAGFWFIWLLGFFIMDYFNVTLLVFLCVGGFLAVTFTACFAREIYDYLCQWFVWARARVRHHCELVGKDVRGLWHDFKKAVQRFFR